MTSYRAYVDPVTGQKVLINLDRGQTTTADVSTPIREMESEITPTQRKYVEAIPPSQEHGKLPAGQTQTGYTTPSQPTPTPQPPPEPEKEPEAPKEPTPTVTKVPMYKYEGDMIKIVGWMDVARGESVSRIVQPSPSVPYSEYEKSLEMGRTITRTKPPEHVSKRTMEYGGEFVFYEPEFVSDPRYETKVYDPATGTTKLETGYYQSVVSLEPITEPELRERETEREIAGLITPEERAKLEESVFEPVEARVQYAPGDVPGVIGKWGVEVGTGFGKVGEMAVKPEFWKGGVALTPYMPFVAYKYGEAMVKEAVERPGEFTGKFAISWAMIGGGVKVAGKLPKIKYETVKLPSGKTVYRGLHLQYGEGLKTKVLIGRAEGKFKLGTPEVDLTGETFKGYVPETPLETKIMMKSMETVYPELEVLKVESFVKGSQITAHQPSKFIQKKFGKEVKTLSPKQFEEVLKFAREEKALLYGSKGAETQMRPGKMGRTAADIDIQLKLGEEATIVKTQELLARLEGKGKKVRISKKHKTMIETFDPTPKKKWHHAVDIHSLESPLESIADSLSKTGREFGFKRPQRPVRIEGIDVMPLSEHGIAKGASASKLRTRVMKPMSKTEGYVAPETHRMKDIGDYITTQQELIDSRRASLFSQFRIIGTLKAEKHLADFQRAWGVELSESVKILLQAPKEPSKISLPPSLVPSPSLAPSPSLYVSRSISLSLSRSVSPSVSKSVSSISKSVSLRVSPHISPSISPPSKPPSPSPSITPSKYPSPLPKPSKYPSPHIPPSPSRSRSFAPPPSIIRPSKGRGVSIPVFHVFTRRAGKWRLISPKPLPKREAFSFGARRVLETPRASFKIVRAGVAIVPSRDLMPGIFESRRRMFRKPKKKSVLGADVFVEKTKFRIDEPGELHGITFKGLAAIRRKKMLKMWGL